MSEPGVRGCKGRGRDYHQKRLKEMRFVYLRKEADRRAHSKIKYQILSRRNT